ncbi:hypothetical protein BO82DRAFT_41682 [Aspergillus uvarum CBS 121591]|uniref:Uncharacterized protein n=1 Tax=Aspergillus uvarum CBS 121591 TaxID=1448315 RepID=A0A319D6A9_9EURO|nr:hypothetical protein BO82DRAFT_41682 [Aspergillus uvarum CBS 121591]PYH83468.1 hypothetical protein BO82DRAFT_41682 [Aspergillus uvarum CBS 121591]
MTGCVIIGVPLYFIFFSLSSFSALYLRVKFGSASGLGRIALEMYGLIRCGFWILELGIRMEKTLGTYWDDFWDFLDGSGWHMGGRNCITYPVHIWGLPANATWSRANE